MNFENLLSHSWLLIKQRQITHSVIMEFNFPKYRFLLEDSENNVIILKHSAKLSNASNNGS